MHTGNSTKGPTRSLAVKEGHKGLDRTMCRSNRLGSTTPSQKNPPPPGGAAGIGSGSQQAPTTNPPPTQLNSWVLTSRVSLSKSNSWWPFWEKSTGKSPVGESSSMHCSPNKKRTSRLCLTSKSSAKNCGRSGTVKSKFRNSKPRLSWPKQKHLLQKKRRTMLPRPSLPSPNKKKRHWPVSRHYCHYAKNAKR